MLSNRPLDGASGPDHGRREPQPADSEWLEACARRYAARWETSEANVARLLARKARERGERSDEDADRLLELIPAVVAGLVERGFVDDRRFAASKLENLRRKGGSSAAIRGRLEEQGVPSTLVDELFSQEEPSAELLAAWTFARRRKLGPYCVDFERRSASRERHLAALGRRGFEIETALLVVDARERPFE